MDLYVLRLAEDGPAIRNGRMRVSKMHCNNFFSTFTDLFGGGVKEKALFSYLIRF